jgi:hypothetical protein
MAVPTDVPTVFATYAKDGDGWQEQVIDFACLLDQYVEVEADFFRFTQPGMDWTRYGPTSIRRADTVLIMSSPAYWDRWDGVNPPDVGAGATRETDALHGLFDRDQRAFQMKVVVVTLPGQSDRIVPYELSRVQQYRIAELSEEGIEPLLRRLLNEPKYRKCARKQLPALFQ